MSAKPKKFKSGIQVEGDLIVPNSTGERAVIINTDKEIVHSSVTQTELERLGGITSDLLEANDKGVANGVASLDAGGKIPSSQIPAIAITDTFTVADIVARDALPTGVDDDNVGQVQKGDVVIVLDASADPAITAGAASYIYDGTVYKLLKAGDEVLSINGETGVVVLDSANLNHTQADDADWTVADESSVAAHLDELAERVTDLEADPDSDENVKVSADDTTAGYLFNKLTLDFAVNPSNILEYNILNPEGNEQLELSFDQTKISHDSLSDYVANQHIDHTSVNIETAANSALSGGGDISATRSLAVDITNAVAESSSDDADLILIYDDSASAHRKMTKADFLDGVGLPDGDIAQTSFAFADNQSTPANVTGLVFAFATVRSFIAEIAVERGADYEHYTITAIQKAASWDFSVESIADDTGITFSIDNNGQVQYVSTSTGDAGTMKFRAKAILI